MASGDLVKKLCEELACSICLEYFKEPVSLSCGHSFCQACLDQGREEEEASCPQCREKVQKRGIKRNWKLANLVEIAIEMEKEKGRLCQRHQEPLKLFCKDHDAPICVVCDRSKEHENHKVIPLDEASKEYKDQIWNYLETLKKEREKILAYKADTARESKYLLEKTQREKEKTVAAFILSSYSEVEVRDYLWQILSAVEYLHAQNILHLDLRSENMIITEPNLLKILDFGNAQFYTPGQVITLDGCTDYVETMASELLSDKGAVPQTDIWSVGVTAFIMLSAEYPIHSEAACDFGRLVKREKVKLNKCYAGLSGGAVSFLQSTLSSNPW
nr:E3 ubiquitin-protein ligase TRIM17 [Anolis sagrei ordinatus]